MKSAEIERSIKGEAKKELTLREIARKYRPARQDKKFDDLLFKSKELTAGAVDDLDKAIGRNESLQYRFKFEGQKTGSAEEIVDLINTKHVVKKKTVFLESATTRVFTAKQWVPKQLAGSASHDGPLQQNEIEKEKIDIPGAEKKGKFLKEDLAIMIKDEKVRSWFVEKKPEDQEIIFNDLLREAYNSEKEKLKFL